LRHVAIADRTFHRKERDRSERARTMPHAARDMHEIAMRDHAVLLAEDHAHASLQHEDILLLIVVDVRHGAFPILIGDDRGLDQFADHGLAHRSSGAAFAGLHFGDLVERHFSTP
jgi:hypothetical protein